MADLGLPEEVATQVSVVQEVMTTRFKINKISLIFFKINIRKNSLYYHYYVYVWSLFGCNGYIHTYIHTYVLYYTVLNFGTGRRL